MSLMFIIFVFIHLSFYGMETVDNSFACSHGSLVKNQVNIQYSTATGKSLRSYQEDRMAVHNDADFFWSCAVFDGHCGSQTSEILADKTNGLLNKLHNQTYLNPDRIKKVYTDYDKKIENSKKNGRSGSTAVTFTVDVMRQQLFLAHCGDSIGLLIQNNKILHWTVPHDLFLDTEATRIEVAGGFFYSGRVNAMINLTRSFGDYDIVGIDNNGSFPQLIIADPEVFEIRLQQKKPVIGLLCSDGFTDYFCSGMRDLNSENIEKKLLDPLATIVCKLIQSGRPISGLAFDLVCLMNWNKSVDQILSSIDTNMDWGSIKNESSSLKSYDNVSVVVFEVSDGQDDNADEQEELPKQNDLNQENTTRVNNHLDSFPRIIDGFTATTFTFDGNQEEAITIENPDEKKFGEDVITHDENKAIIPSDTPKNSSSITNLNSIDTNMNSDFIKNESTFLKSSDNVSVVVFEVSDGEYNNANNKQEELLAELPKKNDLNQKDTTKVDNEKRILNENKFNKDVAPTIDKNKVTIPGNTPKNPSLITKVFNYAKSLISFKRICLGFLTAYILKQLYRFKNA